MNDNIQCTRSVPKEQVIVNVILKTTANMDLTVSYANLYRKQITKLPSRTLTFVEVDHANYVVHLKAGKGKLV